jgi:rhamnosyl/mannosyltransferase
MKILQISPRFYPAIGGVEKVVYELSKQLIFTGHNITFLKNEPFHLFNFLRTSKPDIVHVHSSKFLISDASIIIAYLMGIPSVVTLHVNDHANFLKGRILLPIYKDSIRKLIFKTVDRIIIPSKMMLEDASLRRYKNKIVVIPHGINFKSHKKEEHKKFRVLFVGKLDKKMIFKGLNYLIKAMTEINENIELIVVGDGDIKEYYKKLVKKLKIKVPIKFLGYIKENELYEWYSKVDCLALPSISRQESFGLVALEAMSMGLPVIVTNVCGISPIVKESESGIIIEPKKPEQIANSIRKLYNDKKLMKKLGKNALKTAKNYSWRKVARIYSDIYEDILQAKGDKY